MTHEAVCGIQEPQLEVERNAAPILKDGGWHYANFAGQKRLTMDDYSPMTVYIDGENVDPFAKQAEYSREQSYRVIFQRNSGSWGREGADLICRGTALIEDEELPVTLFVSDKGSFMKHTPKVNPYRATRQFERQMMKYDATFKADDHTL